MCEVDLFVFFFRHRARLLQRHLWRAYTAAWSRARAAAVVAKVFQTAETSFQSLKRSCPKAVRQMAVASSSFFISLQ